MNTYIQKTKEYIMNNKKTVGAIVVVLLAVLYFARGGSSTEKLYTVVRGDVVQKVIVIGKTKAVSSVDLGFETNGKVTQAYADVGTRVGVGQTLLVLESGESYASVLRAQSTVDKEQAKLDQMKRGSRPEEIAISQTEVTNAQTSLSDAQANLASKVTDSYTKADDAIYNTIDALFSNPRTNNPQINFSSADTQVKNDVNSSRVDIGVLLSSWKLAVGTVTPDDTALSQTNLAIVKNFIEKVSSIVNSQSSNSNISQATVDGYKTSISNARTNISTAITNLTTAVEKVNSAQSALTLAQRNLDLKKGGSTAEDIKSQEAQVAGAQADLLGAQSQLGKLTLRSPLSGVVTRQDAKVGEIVTPGKSVVSIISDSDLQIESNVSEINIGKVVVGNPVEITLDAFPGQTFLGTVSYIDPAETLVDGVVNYKVTITFNQKYPEMKSGLTTNLTIQTAVKKDVVRIPDYSLIRTTDGVFVSRQSGGKFTQVPVTLGLSGGDGSVEVLSGLTVGDVIDMVVVPK